MHRWGLSPECRRWWLFNSLAVVVAYSHPGSMHLWGFSPECRLWWTFNEPAWAQAYSHPGALHWKGLSPVWIRKCRFNSLALGHDYSHPGAVHRCLGFGIGKIRVNTRIMQQWRNNTITQIWKGSSATPAAIDPNIWGSLTQSSTNSTLNFGTIYRDQNERDRNWCIHFKEESFSHGERGCVEEGSPRNHRFSQRNCYGTDLSWDGPSRVHKHPPRA